MAMTIPTVITMTMTMLLSVDCLVTLLLRCHQYKKARVFWALLTRTSKSTQNSSKATTISTVFAALSQTKTHQKPRTKPHKTLDFQALDQ